MEFYWYAGLNTISFGFILSSFGHFIIFSPLPLQFFSSLSIPITVSIMYRAQQITEVFQKFQIYYTICPGHSVFSILLIIRFIVLLKAHRFKLAKIVLLWEYNLYIQGILQQGQNQLGEKVSLLPLSKNRGNRCPSFPLVLYLYIQVDINFHIYLPSQSCIWSYCFLHW